MRVVQGHRGLERVSDEISDCPLAFGTSHVFWGFFPTTFWLLPASEGDAGERLLGMRGLGYLFPACSAPHSQHTPVRGICCTQGGPHRVSRLPLAQPRGLRTGQRAWLLGPASSWASLGRATGPSGRAGCLTVAVWGFPF